MRKIDFTYIEMWENNETFRASELGFRVQFSLKHVQPIRITREQFLFKLPFQLKGCLWLHIPVDKCIQQLKIWSHSTIFGSVQGKLLSLMLTRYYPYGKLILDYLIGFMNVNDLSTDVQLWEMKIRSSAMDIWRVTVFLHMNFFFVSNGGMFWFQYFGRICSES
mgnify:FL=1